MSPPVTPRIVSHYCEPTWHHGRHVPAAYVITTPVAIPDGYGRGDDTTFATCGLHLRRAIDICLDRGWNVRVRQVNQQTREQ